MKKQSLRRDWKIDGRVFSISELLEGIIAEALDIAGAEEARFDFSGNYDSLKKHIERFSSDRGTRYIVSKVADISNEGNKLNMTYNVVVRRRKE